MNDPRILVTICARGGSKGFPGKHLKKINGVTLIGHAIACAQGWSDITDVVVSTDDPEIAAVAAVHVSDRQIIMRSPDLALDTTPKIEVIRNVVDIVEDVQQGDSFDYVVDLDVGCPARTWRDIRDSIRDLRLSPGADAITTVYEAERNPYFNMVEKSPQGVNQIERVIGRHRVLTDRQSAPEVLSVSPAVVAWTKTGLWRAAHLHEGVWLGRLIPRERAIDIDTELDYRIVKGLMEGKI